MSALSVDIENDFRDVFDEAALLAAAITLPSAESDDAGEALHWAVIAGIAAGVEKVYSGCERIMQTLARDIDGAPVGVSESWHLTLLNRMANPYPGVRDSIISAECKGRLDGLRSFRHRVRSSYGIRLDDGLVLERAGEVGDALTRFHDEVTAFLAKHSWV